MRGRNQCVSSLGPWNLTRMGDGPVYLYGYNCDGNRQTFWGVFAVESKSLIHIIEQFKSCTLFSSLIVNVKNSFAWFPKGSTSIGCTCASVISECSLPLDLHGMEILQSTQFLWLLILLNFTSCPPQFHSHGHSQSVWSLGCSLAISPKS